MSVDWVGNPTEFRLHVKERSDEWVSENGTVSDVGSYRHYQAFLAGSLLADLREGFVGGND